MNYILALLIMGIMLTVWIEIQRYRQNGKRGSAYELIDLQEEMRRREKKKDETS